MVTLYQLCVLVGVCEWF